MNTKHAQGGMWRPDNWDKLINRDYYGTMDNHFNAGVEAGADAMFEVFFKKGSHVEIGYGDNPPPYFEKNGIYIEYFIPDELLETKNK